MASQLRLLKANADAEVLAANDQSIEEELDAINAGCAKLGVQIKEIDPDGHWYALAKLSDEQIID